MPLTEIQTRQEIIDSQLTKAGWGFSSRSLVEEFYIKSNSKVFEKLGHYASKGEFADYVLLDKDNKPLAIVEAKRTNRDELAGKRQAADYADNLKKQFGFDPFIFLTNGNEIQFWDRQNYPPRKVSGFYTREDLERLVHQRILFLADRRQLVRQAMGSFKEHLPNECIGRIEGGKTPLASRVQVATYPSMMHVYERLSVGYYDLIIADESHRIIYNRYKMLFDWFDAIQIGLTATPTDFIDHNTFELFGCDDGVPIFIFAISHAHAKRLYESFSSLYPEYQRKGLDSVGQQRLDNLNDLVGLSSRWRNRLRHLVQATAKKYRNAKLEDLQLKLLEEAENMVYEKKNMPWAILREGFYRKMAEGYKPLLDELLVEIGDLDPVTLAEH